MVGGGGGVVCWGLEADGCRRVLRARVPACAGMTVGGRRDDGWGVGMTDERVVRAIGAR